MKRIELLCFVLLGLSILMAYNGMTAARPIILVASGINVLFYLVTGIGLTRNTFLPAAWKHTSPEMRPSLIMKTASGIVFSFCILAIAFNELFVRHFISVAIAGVVLLTVVMFFSMRLLEVDQPKLNRGILFRSSVLSILLTFYVVTPLSTRLSWRFDDVYYRELLLYALDNPNDEDAQRHLLDYEMRMEGQVPFEPLE
jgi:hypothetical protein